MAIELATLEAAAARVKVTKSEVALEHARVLGLKTVFLCHSHADETFVRGFIQLLEEARWDAYVDWMDDAMPAKPDKTTATRIKSRIKQADYFMFLATPNSTASRWCPWEIGYADGVKPLTTIMIVQTRDSKGQNYGNEYLDLYRHVDVSKQGDLATWNPGQKQGHFVKSL